MSNPCDYEIHVRGNKKAALLMFAITPVMECKEISFEYGTDDDYIVHIQGDCAWSLDPGHDEKPDVKFNLDELTEEDIRDADRWKEFWYLPMRQKSELLGLKVLAHSWESGAGYDLYQRYDKGVLKKSKEYPYYDEDSEEDEMEFIRRASRFFSF